ncbi:MAG: SDR family oxidoreductase [Pseudonocardia sp.]|nr:SDR family oxidoreductase [Pseudonocardia sp.]
MERTALVTGANRGLGRAVAQQLHRQGLGVLVGARDGAEARRVAATFGPGPAGHALGVTIDVTDPAQVSAAAQRHVVDILVSNAGVMLDGGSDPLTVSLDAVEETLRVNLLGSWRVLQAFLPGMIARGWGRVVLVSSGTGAFSNGLFPGAPGYSVSKTALNGLTMMMAAQTSGSGVLINAVNPGPTRTRMMPKAEQTPEAAALDIAWAATLPDDGPTGAFLRRRVAASW